MGPLIGGAIATVLSLMVLSRAVIDNPLYRVAQYLLVGVALGYVASVLVNQTLVPAITRAATGTPQLDQRIILGISAGLLLLLLPRFGSGRGSFLANVPLAVLFGIGAALALYGAARGTIVPLLLDSIAFRRLNTPDPAAIAGAIALLVTLAITLLSFKFVQPRAEPSALENGARRFGRGLVLATFGFFLAGAITTYLTALVGQLDAITRWFTLLANSF